MISRPSPRRSVATRLLLLVLVTVLLTVVARPCLMLLHTTTPPAAPVMQLDHAHHGHTPAPAPVFCQDGDCSALTAIEKHQPAKRAIVQDNTPQLPVLALLCWLLPLLLVRRPQRLLKPPVLLPDRLPPPLRFRVLLI